MLLGSCSAPPPPPAPAEQVKPDPAKEPWYAQTVQDLQAMNREAKGLIEKGKNSEAATIVTSGQLLSTRLLSAPEPTLAAMEAVSDLDDLYARMLLRNRHYEWARSFFQKNATRWKYWRPATPDTAVRLKAAQAGIAECDRGMR